MVGRPHTNINLPKFVGTHGVHIASRAFALHRRTKHVWRIMTCQVFEIEFVGILCPLVVLPRLSYAAILRIARHLDLGLGTKVVG